MNTLLTRAVRLVFPACLLLGGLSCRSTHEGEVVPPAASGKPRLVFSGSTERLDLSIKASPENKITSKHTWGIDVWSTGFGALPAPDPAVARREKLRFHLTDLRAHNHEQSVKCTISHDERKLYRYYLVVVDVSEWDGKQNVTRSDALCQVFDTADLPAGELSFEPCAAQGAGQITFDSKDSFKQP